MPRKLSFINYKGGVGKTSLVVNLAAAVAETGKRVLLVDLDAQSNSSIWLLRLERWNPLNTADTGHLYSVFEPGVCRLKDCVVRDVVRGPEGEALLLGLDVPKMRMQFRINQFKNQGRVAKDTRIFDNEVRDAVVVRRAVTLGLPVGLVSSVAHDDSVLDDYRKVAQELLNTPETVQ